MIRKVFIPALILILLILGFYTRHWLVYGFNQLKGQLNIIYNAQPISEVIENPLTPDSVKAKLILIREIKKYAVDSLGLAETNNYETYYDQKGKPALWVLTAAPEFKMEPYKWKFPFLGSLSYKGFFQKQKGVDELQLLKKKGFDADLSTVSAWSTLGWFGDPVMSSMMRKNVGSLAELIIHEMTHTTLYVKGNVEFNENLATFIGEIGAEKFLTHKFKDDSNVLTNYINHRKDNRIFSEYVVTSVAKLDSLYKDVDFISLTYPDKLRLKYQKIALIVLHISKLPLKNHQRFEWNLQDKRLPDNTWFLSYSDYHALQPEIYQVYYDSCNSSIRELINHYKK
ncbi:MAG: aminopeptidase [Bacteroidetes bacterium]|nr:aminopeptidase [Bacteroidota bacterium]MBX7238621.1 aminopeptidase [Bacteroidia bacterium]HCI57491.1 aminopeptidase [Bacteroidota bacterium]HMU77352.1 aminopeptidase [Bacteroidia bacterium]HMW10124.1 aminopeptidase [Bacteroidia bacterium]